MIGDRLRAVMATDHWSVRSFSLAVGVSERTVRIWRNGHGDPDAASLKWIARVTRRPLNWWFGLCASGEHSMNPSTERCLACARPREGATRESAKSV